MSDEIRIAGHEVSKPSLIMIGVGAAVILFVVARNRAAAMTADTSNPAATLPGNDAEFAMITAQSADQFAQLQSDNALEQRRIDSAFQLQAGVTPGLQRTCIGFSQWLELDAATKANLTLQVKRGTMIQSVTSQGICFTPTQTGITGYQQPVTYKSSSGLLSGSQSVTGPPGTFNTSVGGPTPTPSLVSLANSILTGVLDYGNHQTVPRSQSGNQANRVPAFTPGIAPGYYYYPGNQA